MSASTSRPNLIGNIADYGELSEEEEFFLTKEDYLKELKALRYEKEMTLKPKSKHRIILWFRNDLRTHDSGIINWATS